MCNHHLKFYFDDATYTTHQQPAQQPARMGARQSLVSIYIAQPNPALRRPVLLLLCGARDMCSCHDRDHRAARCLNRSTLCGAEVWAVPASWARQVGCSVPRVCSLFRSSLVASAVLLDGGLLAMTANAPTMLSPSSSTCPSLAATHELISW